MIGFRDGGAFSNFFHSFLSHCFSFSIQSGTLSPDFFIRLAIVRTKVLSSSVKSVIAFPFLPALPVRPMRWMYETKLYGKSKFTTWFTVLKSMPLDIKSVQIRIQILPSLNYFMISSRSSFFLSAWITSILSPSNLSSLYSCFARCLDCTKMSIGGS